MDNAVVLNREIAKNLHLYITRPLSQPTIPGAPYGVKASQKKYFRNLLKLTRSLHLKYEPKFKGITDAIKISKRGLV